MNTSFHQQQQQMQIQNAALSSQVMKYNQVLAKAKTVAKKGKAEPAPEPKKSFVDTMKANPVKSVVIGGVVFYGASQILWENLFKWPLIHCW